MQHSSAASCASLSAILLPCMPICEFTLSRIVSSPARARCMSSCPIASSSGLWQSPTVGDGDLRCTPIFFVKHFEPVAMLSVTPGLQCLRAIKSATSSALLMVLSMLCLYGGTLRLRCACLCSLYTPEPVTRPMCGISFLLPSMYMISFGRTLSSVLWETSLKSSLVACSSGDHALAGEFVAFEQCLGGYRPGREAVCCMVIFSCFGLCGGFPS